MAEQVNTNKKSNVIEHIKTQKVKLQVTLKNVGYIKLLATKKGKRIQYHAATITKKSKVSVMMFKSKKSFLADKLISKTGNMFKSILNKTVSVMKEVYSKVRDQFKQDIEMIEYALKLASLRHYDTVQRFPLMVELTKAKNDLRSFKYSLPRIVRNQIF